MLLGHIFGGIATPQNNPFANNQTNQTSADASIYEVWLVKDGALKTVEINGKNPYQITVYPNPVKQQLTVKIEGKKIENAAYFITSTEGKVVQEGALNPLSDKNETTIELAKTLTPQNYIINIVVNNKYYLQAKFKKE